MLSVVLVLPLLFRGLDALDCCALGFGDFDPSKGNDSRLCIRDGEDCCGSYYLEELIAQRAVRKRLERNLVREYEYGINVTSLIVEGFIKYFEDYEFERDIIYATVASLGHKNTSKESESIFQNLSERWSGLRNGSTCQSVRDLIRSMVISTVESNFKNEDSKRECIIKTTQERINDETLVKVPASLVPLYNSYIPMIKKLNDFILSQRGRVTNVNLSSACIDGFVEAGFCQKCVERTPPLCLETCNALVRGCYSPHYTVLNGQFGALWSEIKHLSLAINSTVNTVLNFIPTLVDYQQLFLDIKSTCGSDETQEKAEDVKSIGIPSSIMEQVMEIDGPFQYASGTMVCGFAVDNKACDEGVPVPPTGGCTITNMTQLKVGEYTSDPAEFSTSECECFDGIDFTTDEDTTIIFEGNDIHDQGDNPAFRPPLNVTELESKVRLLQQELENPVNEFLSSTEYTRLSQRREEEDLCGDRKTTPTPTPATSNSVTIIPTSQTVHFMATITTIYSFFNYVCIV